MSFGSIDDTAIEKNLLVEAQVLESANPAPGVVIEVINEKGGITSKDTTKDNGYFSVKLNFDSVFVLKFKKDGYVTKMVAIDTRNMLEEDKEFGYDLGMFKLSMLKREEKKDYSLYKQPIARFSYNEIMQIFVVDKAYKKVVKKRFDDKGEKPEIIKF
ncbi:MAG: hypothetical protein CL840_14705 [Crocinitomicaceae bacterium]|nr:hypothetical protein [Crocinitomicaceae bacterium]